MERRGWLDEAIVAAGMDRASFARRCGVTEPAVSHWVVGRRLPGGATRRLIAIVLGMSVADVDTRFAGSTEQDCDELQVGAA